MTLPRRKKYSISTNYSLRFLLMAPELNINIAEFFLPRVQSNALDSWPVNKKKR